MAQRITATMLTNGYLRNLNNSMKRMSKLENQMANNGARYEKMSDNPVAAVYGLQARARLARIEQYTSNAADARSWLTDAETNVSAFNEVMQTTYEDLIYWTTDVKTPADRDLVASKVKEMREHLVQTANATYSDKYVYGGYNTVSPPFKVDETTGILCYKGVPMYSNDPADYDDVANAIAALGDEHIQFEVGFSIYMDVNLVGSDVMGINDKNMYKILDDLYNALTASEEVLIDPADYTLGTEIKYTCTADDIKGFIKPLQQAQQRMSVFMGELGGRQNRLEMLGARYAIDEVNYTELMTYYESEDIEKIYMNFTNAMNAYNAALSFGSKVIPMSLANFIN